MRLPTALHLILAASVIFWFCGAALNDKDTRYSMTQATVQQPSTFTEQADFSQRLQGGTLLRFEFGLIVVKPTAPQESLQHTTALTTDAIITSSVRSKIASQSQLPPGVFEVQTDDGVVTIRSKVASLDQAAEVINLALCVPDVQQIVYTMQNSEFGSQNSRLGTASDSSIQDVYARLAKLSRTSEF